jgi:hypothetical protein
MLTFAATIDLIEMIILLFALDDFWILDVVSGSVIGGWMLFRKGKVVNIKAQKKQLVRFLAGMGIEIIPYLGALPAVTVITLLTLRDKPMAIRPKLSAIMPVTTVKSPFVRE